MKNFFSLWNKRFRHFRLLKACNNFSTYHLFIHTTLLVFVFISNFFSYTPFLLLYEIECFLDPHLSTLLLNIQYSSGRTIIPKHPSHLFQAFKDFFVFLSLIQSDAREPKGAKLESLQTDGWII